MSYWAGKSVRSSKVRARGLKVVNFCSQSFVCELKQFKPNDKGVPGQHPATHQQNSGTTSDGRTKTGTAKTRSPGSVREEHIVHKSILDPKRYRTHLAVKATGSWHSLGIPDTSFSGRSTRTARRVRRSKSVPAVARILEFKEEKGKRKENGIKNANSCFQSMDLGRFSGCFSFYTCHSLDLLKTSNLRAPPELLSFTQTWENPQHLYEAVCI